MATTDAEIVINVITAISGLILAAAGLLVFVASRKLVRGEVGRKSLASA